MIIDNSTLMFLNLLVKIQPAKVFLAGFDGYNVDGKNYYQNRLQLCQDKETLVAINKLTTRKVVELKHHLNIEFLTTSIYEQ